MTDNISGRRTKYLYDFQDRLMRYDEAAYRDFDVGMSVLAGLYMPLGDYYGSWSQHTGFMSDTISLNFHDYTGSNRFGINSQLTLRLGKLSQLNSSDLHALGYAYSGFFSSDSSDDGLKTEGVWVQGTPSSILALLEEDCVAGTYNYAADTVLWKE